MKIKQLSIFLENKTGSLSDILEILRKNDINLRALSLADANDFGILRLIVNNPIKVKEILEKEDFIVKITDIVAIEMKDYPGSLADILSIIKENNIDLEYLHAFTFNQSKAALFLHTDDIDNLIDVLLKNNIVLLKQEQF